MKSNTAVQEAPGAVVAVLPKSSSVSQGGGWRVVSGNRGHGLAVSVQNDEV